MVIIIIIFIVAQTCQVRDMKRQLANSDGRLAVGSTAELLHAFNGFFSRTTRVSRYQKGKTSLDLNAARNDGVLGMHWHQLDHMQTVCTSLQTDNHTSTSSLNFYRPDAVPDAQPTASKH